MRKTRRQDLIEWIVISLGLPRKRRKNQAAVALLNLALAQVPDKGQSYKVYCKSLTRRLKELEVGLKVAQDAVDWSTDMGGITERVVVKKTHAWLARRQRQEKREARCKS